MPRYSTLASDFLDYLPSVALVTPHPESPMSSLISRVSSPSPGLPKSIVHLYMFLSLAVWSRRDLSATIRVGLALARKGIGLALAPCRFSTKAQGLY